MNFYIKLLWNTSKIMHLTDAYAAGPKLFFNISSNVLTPQNILAFQIAYHFHRLKYFSVFLLIRKTCTKTHRSRAAPLKKKRRFRDRVNYTCIQLHKEAWASQALVYSLKTTKKREKLVTVERFFIHAFEANCFDHISG